MSRTKLSWWCTERGREVALGCVTLGTLGAVGSVWLPNTYLQDTILPGLRLHRLGKPVELSPELQEKYEQSLEACKIEARPRRFIKPFVAYGFELLTVGNIKTRFGMKLGIPENYEYNSTSDVDPNLQVNSKTVDWTSETGQRLANSLVLTDKEKIFGISRELLTAQYYKTHFCCLYPALTSLFVYGTSSAINVKFDNYRRPRIVRVIIYSLVGCFGLGLYFLMRDSTQFQYERIVDEELCALGKDFIESGVSFYDKILKRNIAIQELTGPDNEMRFSKLGKENFLFRQRYTPILERKRYFESMLAKEQ